MHSCGYSAGLACKYQRARVLHNSALFLQIESEDKSIHSTTQQVAIGLTVTQLTKQLHNNYISTKINE